jgi:hypothetical protein
LVTDLDGNRLRALYEKIADFIFQSTAASLATGIFPMIERADALERAPYFAVVALYALIPWATYRRGSSVAAGPITYLDYLFPLLMCASIILAIVTVALAPSDSFRAIWFALIGFNALLAVGIVSTRLKFTTPAWLGQRLASADLLKYAGWLSVDRWGAAIVALWMFAIAGALTAYDRHVHVGEMWIDVALVSVCVLGAMAIGITVKAIADENYLIRARII